MKTQTIGAAGEALALRYLREQQLELIARNARFRVGEIDLIMRDGATLVFVEVRCRRHHAFGGASASVDLRKQRRLIAAAGLWLARYPRYAQATCRFDLIAIDSGSVPPRCVWYKDAFRPDASD